MMDHVPGDWWRGMEERGVGMYGKGFVCWKECLSKSECGDRASFLLVLIRMRQRRAKTPRPAHEKGSLSGANDGPAHKHATHATPPSSSWAVATVVLFFLVAFPYIHDAMYTNTAHIRVQFNQRKVPVIEHEGASNLTKSCTAVCKENNVLNNQLFACVHMIQTRLAQLFRVQRRDFEEHSVFLKFYWESTAQVVTDEGIFQVRWLPHHDVHAVAATFVDKYRYFFNHYEVNSGEYKSKQTAVYQETLAQIQAVNGRKLEAALLCAHVLLMITARHAMAYAVPDPARRSILLGEVTGIPGNWMGLVRLAVTAMVIWGHAFQLTQGHTKDPLARIFSTDTATIGASVMFFISGFFSMASLDRSRSPMQFLTKALGRTLPYYWATMAISILALGPILADATLHEYLQAPWTRRLLYHALSPSSFLSSWGTGPEHNELWLWPFPGGLHNTVYGSRTPFNASVWTLPMQIMCWTLVAGAAQMNAIGATPLITLLVGILAYTNNMYISCFFAGCFVWRVRDQVTLDTRVLVALVPWMSVFTRQFYYSPRVWFPVLCYASLVVGYACPQWSGADVARWHGSQRWLSSFVLGAYLWGAVVQQALVDLEVVSWVQNHVVGNTMGAAYVNMIVAFPLVGVLAFVTSKLR